MTNASAGSPEVPVGLHPIAQFQVIFRPDAFRSVDDHKT